MARVQIFFDHDPGVTLQEFSNECDINNIVNKYRRTGVINHMATANLIYGDFSNVPDYQEALHIVHQADEAFMRLPAHIRGKFENDAGQFLDYMSNDDNYEEKLKLGLLTNEHDVPKAQIEALISPPPSST